MKRRDEEEMSLLIRERRDKPGTGACNSLSGSHFEKQSGSGYPVETRTGQCLSKQQLHLAQSDITQIHTHCDFQTPQIAKQPPKTRVGEVTLV